jgi:hypothetical protein
MSEAVRISQELPIGTADTVIFTTGIIPTAKRQITAEGLEMDIAVSTLSRHVMLREIMPHLRPEARVFIMGFPGAGQKGELDDLNGEARYVGGLGQTHMNTVAGNEALVHHWAAQGRKVFGLNPGMITTNIRTNADNGCFMRSVERLIGWFGPSAAQYAGAVVPLFVTLELDAAPGALFGQKGTPVLPTPAFRDAAFVKKWIDGLDALVARAKGPAV